MGTVFGVLIGYYVLSGNMFRDIHKLNEKIQGQSDERNN